jgi:hypothetical protein
MIYGPKHARQLCAYRFFRIINPATLHLIKERREAAEIIRKDRVAYLKRVGGSGFLESEDGHVDIVAVREGQEPKLPGFRKLTGSGPKVEYDKDGTMHVYWEPKPKPKRKQAGESDQELRQAELDALHAAPINKAVAEDLCAPTAVYWESATQFYRNVVRLFELGDVWVLQYPETDESPAEIVGTVTMTPAEFLQLAEAHA